MKQYKSHGYSPFVGHGDCVGHGDGPFVSVPLNDDESGGQNQKDRPLSMHK